MCEHCSPDGSHCGVCGDYYERRPRGPGAGWAALAVLAAVFFAALAYALQHTKWN